MEVMNPNFVILAQNNDDNVIDENSNGFENIDEDPLGSFTSQEEPSYYKLDRVVFAEPMEDVAINCEQSGSQEDSGEISFVDNVMIKKKTGKRNKYFMDIKEGSLICPLTGCGKPFASSTLLKAHVRKVHCVTTRCVCEYCGAAFSAPYLLRRHWAVHSRRRLQCHQCGVWLSERTRISLKRNQNQATQH